MQLKQILLLLLLPSFFLAQKVKIKIDVAYLQPYCGGARPDESIVQEMEKPKALRNAYFVILHENGRADSVKTDQNGVLSFRLRKGEYKIYEAWRYKMYTPHNMPITSFDKDCLRSEWEKFAFVVKVKNHKYSVTAVNQIVEYCDWTLPCWTAEILVPPGAAPGR